MKSTRAIAPALVLLYLAITGVAALVASKTIPAFNGEARRAKAGEETTANLIKAGDAVGSAQTASATVIGESVTAMPPSLERDFVLNEIPIMLARGPAPDGKQLLAARDRRIAFLEGNLVAQEKQTKAALADAGRLRTDLAATTAAKQQADAAITIAAAEALAANRTKLGLWLVILALAGAYLWLKRNTVGLSALGTARAMVIKGEKTMEDALDGIVPHELWPKVKAGADKHFTAADFQSKPPAA